MSRDVTLEMEICTLWVHRPFHPTRGIGTRDGQLATHNFQQGVAEGLL